MTEIDFYVLSAKQSRFDFALRLCQKVYGMGHNIFICTEDASASDALSDALWSVSDHAFMAHSLIDANAEESLQDRSPIKIAHNICNDSAPLLNNDVLINLALEIPPHFSRFKRHVEIVGDNESVRAQLRQHHHYYKQRGYPLRVHNVA